MYEPGDTIESMGELLHLLHLGRFIYLFNNGKPSHPAVVRQQRLAELERLIAARRLRRASIRDEWAEWMATRRRPFCDECGQNPVEAGSKICVGRHAYRDHTGAI
jgi:hypothetical protein